MAGQDSSVDDSDLIVDAAKPESKNGSWLPLILVLLFIPLSSYLLTNFVMVPQLQAAMGGGENVSGGGSGTSRKANAPVFYHDLTGVVVNVAGTMGTRYLRVSFRVAGPDPALDGTLRDKRAKVMDGVIAVLSLRTIPELEESGGRVALRSALIDGINDSLERPMVEELYFTEFVVQ